MKKYLPQFYETLFANLLFWAIVFGIFYFMKENSNPFLIIGIAVIVVIYALLAALKAYFKKNKTKVGVYICQGIMGIINLTLCSASLVKALGYLAEKKYILLGIYTVLAFILFYKFDQLFQEEKQKN